MSKTSQVLNFVKECPVKGIIISLFVAVNFSVNWYIKVDTPLKERCSSKYPEFSRILDHPVTLPDGGMMSGDGEVFPEGSWWSEDSIVRGCPCSGKKTCVRKCCPFGQAFEGPNCVDSKDTDKFENSLMFYMMRDVEEANAIKQISVLPSRCDITYVNSSKEFSLTDDGTLKSNFSKLILTQKHYCLETSNSDAKNDLMVFLCSLPEMEYQWEVIRRKIRKYVLFFTMVLFLLVNLFTLAVFAFLPKLRQGYGPSIMCYMAARSLRSINFITLHFDWIQGLSFYCMYAGATNLFINLSSSAWQIVIAHQIWLVFSPGTGVANALNRSKQTKRFLVYNVLAWGSSLLIVVLMVTMDLVPGAPQFLKSQFEPNTCRTETAARWVYHIGPGVLGEVVTMSLCVATLRRLVAFRKSSEVLQNSHSRRHNAKQIQWSEVYTKVCLLMGVSYLLVGVLQLTTWMISVPQSIVRTAHDVNSMRGVEVFLILVCKPEVLYSFLQKIKPFWKRSN